MPLKQVKKNSSIVKQQSLVINLKAFRLLVFHFIFLSHILNRSADCYILRNSIPIFFLILWEKINTTELLYRNLPNMCATQYFI